MLFPQKKLKIINQSAAAAQIIIIVITIIIKNKHSKVVLHVYMINRQSALHFGKVLLCISSIEISTWFLTSHIDVYMHFRTVFLLIMLKHETWLANFDQ